MFGKQWWDSAVTIGDRSVPTLWDCFADFLFYTSLIGFMFRNIECTFSPHFNTTYTVTSYVIVCTQSLQFHGRKSKSSSAHVTCDKTWYYNTGVPTFSLRIVVPSKSLNVYDFGKKLYTFQLIKAPLVRKAEPCTFSFPNRTHSGTLTVIKIEEVYFTRCSVWSSGYLLPPVWGWWVDKGVVCGVHLLDLLKGGWPCHPQAQVGQFGIDQVIPYNTDP